MFRWRRALGGCLVSGLAFGPLDGLAAASLDEVKVGCVLTLTGPGAAGGRAIRMALEDHVKAVNGRGGIRGRRIALIVYDDQGSYEQAMGCDARLMDQDHVAGILGNGWAHSAAQMAPRCASARVPFITRTTYSGATRNVSGRPWAYTFRVGFTIPAQAAALADYGYRERGLRKVAILYDINTYTGMEFSTRFETAFVRLGGKVVATATFQEGASTDFRTHLARIGPARPDCLLVPYGTSQQLALVARQARAAGLQIPILGGEAWGANDLPALGGADVEGVVFAAGVQAADPRFSAFNARFLQAHGTRCEPSVYLALDAAMILDHAVRVSVERTGKVRPELMRDALEHLRGVPVFTGRMTMDPGTHDPRDRPVRVMALKDGRPTLLRSSPPG